MPKRKARLDSPEADEPQADASLRKQRRLSTSSSLKKSLKNHLRTVAGSILEAIEQDDLRQTVQIALTTVVKGLLEDFDALEIAEDVTLVENVDETDLAATDDVGLLEETLEVAQLQLQQAEADLKQFRKSRKQSELKERDQERDHLHPLVKALYPEMGRRVSNLQSTDFLDAPPYLRTLALKKVEQLETEEEEEGMLTYSLYQPDQDDWLTDYLVSYASQLNRINKVTHPLDAFDEVLDVALGAIAPAE